MTRADDPRNPDRKGRGGSHVRKSLRATPGRPRSVDRARLVHRHHDDCEFAGKAVGVIEETVALRQRGHLGKMLFGDPVDRVARRSALLAMRCRR